MSKEQGFMLTLWAPEIWACFCHCSKSKYHIYTRLITLAFLLFSKYTDPLNVHAAWETCPFHPHVDFLFFIHIFVQLFLSDNPLLHSLTTKISRFISSFSLASYHFPVAVHTPWHCIRYVLASSYCVFCSRCCSTRTSVGLRTQTPWCNCLGYSAGTNTH